MVDKKINNGGEGKWRGGRRREGKRGERVRGKMGGKERVQEGMGTVWESVLPPDVSRGVTGSHRKGKSVLSR